MKKLIILLAILAIGCKTEIIKPYNDGLNSAPSGFNNKVITDELGQDILVYSKGVELHDGLTLYINKVSSVGVLIMVSNGKYTHELNPVFWYEFNINNGRICNLTLKTEN